MSAVWTCFSISEKNARIAICKTCYAEISSVKTFCKHPDRYAEYERNAAQKSRTPPSMRTPSVSERGKENSVPSSTGGKKEVAKGNAHAENDKHLRPFSKAPTLIIPRLPVKTTLSQTSSEQARTRCQETARAVRNSTFKVQHTKPGLHRNVMAPKQDKTVKKGPAPVPSQAQPFHRSSINAHTSIKTDLLRRNLVKGSEKEVHKSQVKCLTNKEYGANSCTDSKSFISKQATVLLKTSKETNNLNKTQNNLRKPLNSKSLTEPDASVKKQTKSQDKQALHKLGNKPGFTCTQKSLLVTGKQKSSLLSAFSKTEDASKSASAPVAAFKKAAPTQQRQCTTFKLPIKPIVQAPVPQTLPRLSKMSSLTKVPVQPKTPKSTFNPGTDGVRTVPLDGRKKSTLAQEERLRKLKEWREAKGITYKRPPMPVQPTRRQTTTVPPQGYWSTMEQEDEVQGFVCAVDQSLNDCIKLLQQGCPVDQVRDVLSRVPMAQKFAKYWICQVRLLEQEGNFDVLPTFEEAVRIVREPVDELRSVVFEILKKKEAKGSSSETENVVSRDEDREHSFNKCTPKPVGALIRGEKRDSSVIKYKITATPGGKRSQQRPGRVNGQEVRFFTPVRRSLRIQKTASRYPAVLQEHDHCVTSFHDLLAESEGQSETPHTAETHTSPLYVYRENDALKEQVQIQLVYDDAQ
ncbi:cytoskeleton-associated protein 2-like [Silurus asotus]|uniref:Cytoskeleton-associated protein 2-like n=1 Tax=Silurus asotus TaxID=30991 RepID=A0AAD5ABH8_SILAS|nr:cytoskeleton-associated protein 2-like [Silurus asotus]